MCLAPHKRILCSKVSARAITSETPWSCRNALHVEQQRPTKGGKLAFVTVRPLVTSPTNQQKPSRKGVHTHLHWICWRLVILRVPCAPSTLRHKTKPATRHEFLPAKQFHGSKTCPTASKPTQARCKVRSNDPQIPIMPLCRTQTTPECDGPNGQIVVKDLGKPQTAPMVSCQQR